MSYACRKAALPMNNGLRNLDPRDGIPISFQQSDAGYAGTAIYSRLPFVSIKDGLGFELADSQGRFISAEFDLGLSHPVHIASLYLPSGSSGEEAQARKDLF